MKHIALLIIFVFAAQLTFAQSPKAVIKCALEGDYYKAKEKFDKIDDKTQSEQPEMCALAEAVLLNMETNSGSAKVRGYSILSKNYMKIKSSPHLAKTLKGLDTSFDALRRQIEKSSMTYVLDIDHEDMYATYLKWARSANHLDLRMLEQRYENRMYENVCHNNTIEEYDRFLASYPESEFAKDVTARRTDLYYNAAMTSHDAATVMAFIENYPNYAHIDSAKSYLIDIYYDEALECEDEEQMARFIESYPNYPNLYKVEGRLMAFRYRRVAASGDIEQMRWFVELYPSFEELPIIKQKMADMEYPSVEESREALETFIAYYPTTTQCKDAKRRIMAMDIVESGDISGLVRYVTEYGYDQNYHRLSRSIAKIKGIYILTPDISAVTHLRFANAYGKVGYMDLTGKIVVAAKYQQDQIPSFIGGEYNRLMMMEFTPERQRAAVRLNGKWGVIDPTGKTILQHRFVDIHMDNCVITGAARIAHYGESCDETNTFYCAIYNIDGKTLAENVEIYSDYLNNVRSFELSQAATPRDVCYLTPKYGALYDHNSELRYVVSLSGEKHHMKYRIESGITDNIVVGSIVEDGTRKNYFIDLDRMVVIKECPYRAVGPMHCSRAAVWDGNKVGFIDENLELVIPLTIEIEAANFEEAASSFDLSANTEAGYMSFVLPQFSAGAVAVSSPDKGYMLIDKEGKQIGDKVYESIFSLNNGYGCNMPGLFIISESEISNNSYKVRYAIIDSMGQMVTPWLNDWPYIVGATVKSGSTKIQLYKN